MTWERRKLSRGPILEILGLEEQTVHQRATTADACLNYYQSDGRGLHYAGSMAVLAASCWTLTDTVTSRDRWRQAADIYSELAHPYAQILPICAGEIVHSGTANSSRITLEFCCRLLRIAWNSVTTPQSSDSCRAEVDSLSRLAQRIGTNLSGQLLLPANYVYDFSAAIVYDWPEHGVTTRIVEAAKRILVRASAAVQSAQNDQFHWRRILPGFMPVEPEWLSIGRIVYEAVARSNINGEIITESLKDIENLPIQIAELMPPPESTDVVGPATPGPYRDSGNPSSLEEDEIDMP